MADVNKTVNIEITGDAGQAVAAMDRLAAASDKAAASQKELGKGGGGGVQSLAGSMNEARRQVAGLAEEADRTGKSISELARQRFGSGNSLSADLSVAASEMDRARGAANGLGKATEKAGASAKKSGSGFSEFAKKASGIAEVGAVYGLGWAAASYAVGHYTDEYTKAQDKYTIGVKRAADGTLDYTAAAKSLGDSLSVPAKALQGIQLTFDRLLEGKNPFVTGTKARADALKEAREEMGEFTAQSQQAAAGMKSLQDAAARGSTGADLTSWAGPAARDALSVMTASTNAAMVYDRALAALPGTWSNLTAVQQVAKGTQADLQQLWLQGSGSSAAYASGMQTALAATIALTDAQSSYAIGMQSMIDNNYNYGNALNNVAAQQVGADAGWQALLKDVDKYNATTDDAKTLTDEHAAALDKVKAQIIGNADAAGQAAVNQGELNGTIKDQTQAWDANNTSVKNYYQSIASNPALPQTVRDWAAGMVTQLDQAAASADKTKDSVDAIDTEKSVTIKVNDDGTITVKTKIDDAAKPRSTKVAVSENGSTNVGAAIAQAAANKNTTVNVQSAGASQVAQDIQKAAADRKTNIGMAVVNAGEAAAEINNAAKNRTSTITVNVVQGSVAAGVASFTGNRSVGGAPPTGLFAAPPLGDRLSRADANLNLGLPTALNVSAPTVVLNVSDRLADWVDVQVANSQTRLTRAIRSRVR